MNTIGVLAMFLVAWFRENKTSNEPVQNLLVTDFRICYSQIDLLDIDDYPCDDDNNNKFGILPKVDGYPCDDDSKFGRLHRVDKYLQVATDSAEYRPESPSLLRRTNETIEIKKLKTSYNWLLWFKPKKILSRLPLEDTQSVNSDKLLFLECQVTTV